jgi:formylglycine-generating enzyme required for sulfatase activity
VPRVPDAGEWYAACSKFGANAYPYGTTYSASSCNDNTAAPTAVGTFKACEGSVSGLFDMTGNVYEFIDSCAAGGETCRSVGGDYAIGSSASCTATLDTPPVTQAGAAVGFRCCASAP